MLFKNIIFFSLLALQAGFSGAKPLIGHERREATLAEHGAELSRRQSYVTILGAIQGTDADDLSTYGLATCPGLAASGTAAQAGGINKVLAHIRCAPPGGPTYQQQIAGWVGMVQASGMTNIKVVVDILDPTLAPAPAQQAQININTAAQTAAFTFGSYATHVRDSVADPPPSGEMTIQQDGTITIGGQPVM